MFLIYTQMCYLVTSIQTSLPGILLSSMKALLHPAEASMSTTRLRIPKNFMISIFECGKLSNKISCPSKSCIVFGCCSCNWRFWGWGIWSGNGANGGLSGDGTLSMGRRLSSGPPGLGPAVSCGSTGVPCSFHWHNPSDEANWIDRKSHGNGHEKLATRWRMWILLYVVHFVTHSKSAAAVGHCLLLLLWISWFEALIRSVRFLCEHNISESKCVWLSTYGQQST